MEYKLCIRCKAMIPLDRFQERVSGYNGRRYRQNVCRVCTRLRDVATRDANPDRRARFVQANREYSRQHHSRTRPGRKATLARYRGKLKRRLVAARYRQNARLKAFERILSKLNRS